MKERPILFSAPMVRAILDGSKSQTRRVVKPQPPVGTVSVERWHYPDPRDHFWAYDGKQLLDFSLACPYGQPADHHWHPQADRLWVRETWQHSNYPFGPYDEDCHFFYRADYLDDPHGPDGEKSPEGKYRQWRPSIHMPRFASRLLLDIAAVRIERLQDITAEDCLAEGVEEIDYRDPDYAGGYGYKYRIGDGFKSNDPGESYAALWESINGTGSWDANPWVWVVEFKKLAGEAK